MATQPAAARGTRRWLPALLAVASFAVGGCASMSADTSVTVAARDGQRIPVRLLKPQGTGPFPAVVLLHDCSGLGPGSSGAPMRWAAEFVARGYVVALPDSFAPRGHPRGVCTTPYAERAGVEPRRRAQDARSALDLLAQQPYVDARRVAVMGASHGGTTTLLAMSPPARTRSIGQAATEFRAAVALYPGCALPRSAVSSSATAGYRPRGPVLILIGEKDDWTPAEACRALVDRAQQDGQPVQIKVYPGVHHAFDSARPVRWVAGRVNANAPTGRGATTGGDPDAWSDSIDQVFRFLAVSLGVEGGDDDRGPPAKVGSARDPRSTAPAAADR